MAIFQMAQRSIGNLVTTATPFRNFKCRVFYEEKLREIDCKEEARVWKLSFK